MIDPDDLTIGFVSLVGAGPGDPGLISVAGLERIQRAQVLVYDRLVAQELVAKAPKDAEVINAGKSPNQHMLSQTEISRILINRSKKGLFVVRLKGGDPFVFGRGGEEAQALMQAGIEFEVIPGITSAIAAPAYAGIPVTHREWSSSFSVVTGHENDEKSESTIDCSSLASVNDTLIFLMSRKSLATISKRLITEGKKKNTPTAAVQWGTLPKQRVVRATLATISSAVENSGLQAPIVIVVGNVVALSNEINWYERRPLFGKRILVTRTRKQAGILSQQLQMLGADVMEIPTIEIVPIETTEITESISDQRLQRYDWTIFTSANGVLEYYRHIKNLGFDSRVLGSTRIAVIGSETEQALHSFGIRADIVPKKFIAESLVEALDSESMEGAQVLLARAAGARDVLPRELGVRGAHVTDLPLYELRRPDKKTANLDKVLASGIDIATFTSSSTVTGCLDLLGGKTQALEGVLVACIGPITAKAAEKAGLHVDLVSKKSTIPGLVSALGNYFRNSPNTE